MRFIDAPLYLRQLIVVCYILTFALSIVGLFAAVRLCKKRSYIILSSVAFVLSFITVFLTMRGSYRYRVNKSVFEPSLTVLKLPLAAHLATAALLLVLAVFGLIGVLLWNKNNLSPVSVKESADTLPAGICFYEQSGLVRLINTEMNRLCVLATGSALLNGESFWKSVSQGETKGSCLPLKTGEKPIVKYNDGKVVSFKRYSHIADGRTIYEIVAADVTEKYRLTDELEEKQAELRQINKRLIVYGENVTELIREKELLAAKIRIHDDMGKLLLATKRRLTGAIDEAGRKQLVRFWQAEIAALKSTRKTIGNEKDNFEVIHGAAKLVGVNIEFFGEQPKSGGVHEKILIHAMHECLTNTVSHANGKTMSVTAEDKGGRYVITVTNDGEKPKGEITEGGGLSGLRSLVERENGRMTVHSAPRFELIIELPWGGRK